jgi:hypothetical protein
MKNQLSGISIHDTELNTCNYLVYIELILLNFKNALRKISAKKNSIQTKETNIQVTENLIDVDK